MNTPGRVAFQRHDRIDLPARMRVVRPGDVAHVDHIDREAAESVLGLEDPPVADAATFALA